MPRWRAFRKGRGKGRGPTLRSRAYSFPACSPHIGGREGLRSLRPKGAVGGFHPNGRERAAAPGVRRQKVYKTSHLQWFLFLTASVDLDGALPSGPRWPARGTSPPTVTLGSGCWVAVPTGRHSPRRSGLCKLDNTLKRRRLPKNKWERQGAYELQSLSHSRRKWTREGPGACKI